MLKIKDNKKMPKKHKKYICKKSKILPYILYKK